MSYLAKIEKKSRKECENENIIFGAKIQKETVKTRVDWDWSNNY